MSKKRKKTSKKTKKAVITPPPPKNPLNLDEKLDNFETNILESEYEITRENSEVLDSIKNNIKDMPSSSKNKISSILDQCCKLLEDVKKFKLQTEKNRTKSTEELKEAKDKLESIQEQEEELKDQEEILKSKMLKFNDDKEDIIRREIDADAGFIARKEQYLESLEKTKNTLLKKYEDFQQKLIEKEGDWQLQKEGELLDKIAARQKILDKRESDLVEREAKIDSEEILFKQRKEGISTVVDQEKRRIEEESNARLLQMESLNTNLKDEIRRLHSQINSFESIRLQLDGRSTEEVNTLIKELKNENTDLRIKLEHSGGSGLQSRYDEICQELENKNDEVYSLICQINEKKQHLTSLEHLQFEKEQVKNQNEQLITHTALLKEGLSQLKAELNDLKEKGENRPVFTELIQLDEKHRQTSRIIGRDNDESLKDFVKALRNNMGREGFDYSEETLELFVGGLAMSRLVILQGISGTGKTSLAQLFAKVVGGEGSHHKVAVQAGWRDNQDLLGYYNAFERKYYEKDFTIGLYRSSTPEFKELPFVILLDEMNLSHVEHYFADLLTELEDQDKSDVLKVRLASGLSQYPNGPQWLIDDQYLEIPPNVWFIGTANKDETTMEFADKTYDRSHVMTLQRRGYQGLSFVPEEGLNSNWTFRDIDTAFEEAKNKHGKKAKDILDAMESDLAKILEDKFDVGWGNRLERQMESFVPVVMSAGGTEGLALDHILATKILREGKVVRRFDTDKKALNELKETVESLLVNYKITPDNSRAVTLLKSDINRKD